uniref:SJCHGC09064 protein n=1 Tax=Schistosoma japonicum TaxID=6182 RepID=Q5D9Z3_SCHJA|nr:SJCHGC09064 protein [Schistosoma japonicum]
MRANRQATTASRRRHTGTGEAYMKPILLTYDEEAVRIARKSKKYLNNTEVDSELAMAAVNAILQKDHQTIQAAKEDEAKQRVPNREESVGNRVGSLHQFMVQQIVLKKNEADERAEKDIRGAILRHADEAKKQPFWTKAYLKTQPNPIFYNPDEEVKKDDTPV